MKTLAELLETGQSNHPAIVIPDGPRVTYAELRAQVESLASALWEAGVRPGETVSIVLGNNLEYVVAFLAVVRVGAIAAPLNPNYTAAELQFYMEDAGAKTLLLPPGEHPSRGAAEALKMSCLEVGLANGGTVRLSRGGQVLTDKGDIEPPDPAAIALFLHTSGTTSRPKGVPLTHANITASIANIRATYDLSSDDVSLAVMPLFHVHGLLGVVFSTLSSGGTVVISQRFSASRFWGDVAAHRVTWYSGAPTIHQILLNRADSDGAPRNVFRFIRSCSAALAPAVLKEMEARFEAPVVEAYGMTEASHQMSSNPLPPASRRVGTVGPGTGVEIAIMDEKGNLLPPGERGEVVIQGANVMQGYRNNPEANASAFTNGWFRTGDQGYLDAEGYLTLTGRIKELINRGGEKIAPLEVDAVLMQHPSVAEAVSFGVLDAKYGEEVHAAVVLKGEATQEEIQRFCLEHLADFKVPKAIHFVEQLPRSATNKIMRREVAAQFAKSQ